MNQDSTWQAPRWSQSSRLPAPQLSAPSAVDPATQTSILDQSSSPHAWIGKSRTEQPARAHETLSRLTEPYTHAITEASSYQPRPYQRHTPAARGDYYGAHQLKSTSPHHETSTRSWRSLHLRDHRLSFGHDTDAPLTLHIPQAIDLPRGSAPSNTLPPDQPYGKTPSIPTTSLPSFASLKEHSAARNEDVDGPEISSMSSRLSCDFCVKLRPLLQDVADAVAELDQSVRAICNPSLNAPSAVPNDCPLSAAQWMLERLRSAKYELRDANRRGQITATSQASVMTADRVSTHSPSNPLKRSAEHWERDDLSGPKRPCSGNSNEQHWQFPPMGFPGRDERRLSIDFTNRHSRPGYSSPPSDSISGSAHPRHMSPTFTQRNLRALPSPSSLAYPPSAAPSLPPPTAPSVGSPATSYQATASIHTTSTNSVTSAHIADLQHQVTLKSLALQTLQSEYASLLQKLQRERVKSQTIEKKTSVADQEVNELTSKNEELAEQIKSLSHQLEECEKKRDAERAEAQREKDQWGRMLEMSGRLHAKVDSERQRLLQEKETLANRLASQGSDLQNSSALKEKYGRANLAHADSRISAADKEAHVSSLMVDASITDTAAASYGEAGASETIGLKREIQQLNARVLSLRTALLQAQRNARELQEHSQSVLRQTSSAIETAIKDDDTISKPSAESRRVLGHRPTPAKQPFAVSNVSPSPHVAAVKPPKSATLDVYHAGGKITTADLSVVARARSPGPEELGISIQPTTSSPEELIRALGPVPSATAPMPPFSFTAGSSHEWDQSVSAQSTVKSSRERFGASKNPEHHITSARNDPTDKARPYGSSPRSYHSSPGAMIDDVSSISGSEGRSPKGYASEPEASRRKSEGKPRPLSELPRLHTLGTPSKQPPSSESQMRDSGYHSCSVMLPPPRPGPSTVLTHHQH
ncbi:hypothetical protein AC579_6793 [Pseudocercospora musae]|uniref:Uncharacterized protein n=1 Tax=Pseudocercospora musae TaxID=113226 RepID=A0A139IQJ1_9PEZI|nr:hypothetical protein AC579_6793 [Pseudocercospora musae]